MDCPVCGIELELTDIDSRQEWTTESFHCNSCGNDFDHTIVYKIQSHEVDREYWNYSEDQINELRCIFEQELEY